MKNDPSVIWDQVHTCMDLGSLPLESEKDLQALLRNSGKPCFSSYLALGSNYPTYSGHEILT